MALVYGMTEDEFWAMNPKRIRPYKKAYEIRLKERDEQSWLQGLYIHQALLSTVGNMFRGKTAKPYSYPDKPFAADKDTSASDRPLTEKERQRQVEALFLSLQVMQSNFNNAQKNEGQ